MMKSFYRSVWISDVHLCAKESQSELLYTFLDSIKCDYLYLVGDMIDVWSTARQVALAPPVQRGHPQAAQAFRGRGRRSFTSPGTTTSSSVTSPVIASGTW